MTMTLPSNRAALAVVGDDGQVTPGMTAFLADQLLPLMAGLWPASANQLDSNARGVAMAWGAALRGFTPRQIRDAVMRLADDVDRTFAPRPAEVKALMMMSLPAPATASAPCQMSLRACEMIAESRVFMKRGAVSAQELATELAAVLAQKAQQGVTVTGRSM